MRRRSWFVGALVLAAGFTSNPEVLRADATWTVRDLDQVADAAVVSVASTPNASARTWMLLRLAEALIKAGDSAHAKNILRGAASDLEPPRDFMSAAARGAIIRDFAKIGDDAAAQALVTADVPTETKINLVTELAVGRAQAGNIGGVRESVKAIALLGASTNPTFASASGLALKRIGPALVEAGATDDALRIAGNLPDKSLSSQIVAETAVKLCHASKTKTGRVLAERAASDARTAAHSVKLPYLMFAPIIAASKALTACEGLAPAAAFVQTAIPANTADATRSALVDQLGQVDLALALAPSRIGNVDDLLRRSRLLAQSGNVAEAAEAMLDASKIISQDRGTPIEKIEKTVALGRLIGLLADHGAYDAAISAAQAIPAINRNQYDLAVLRAAVDHKDAENVRRLPPLIIKAFDEQVAGGLPRQMELENLVLMLANGGYRDEARAIFNQLSAPSQGTISSPARWVQPSMLAELRAAIGELSGALQAANGAGPMVTAPNARQILMLTAMQLAGHSHPTRDQVFAAVQRAKAALPSQVAGPKAWAFSAVASELAMTGDVANALEFEAKIEVEPRAVLSPARDAALSRIADAQMRTRDLRGAFVTAMRMSQGPRWMKLLNLAGEPPRH